VRERAVSGVGLRGDGWVVIHLPELPWDPVVQIAEINGAPEIIGLRLEPRTEDSSTKIRAEDLRALPMEKLRNVAFDARRMDLRKVARSLRRVEKLPGNRLPDALYPQVAEIYEAAVTSGQNPLPTIADFYGVSRAAAAKYVNEARKRGFLRYPARRGVAGSTQRSSPYP
jgi:hypothetical protein